MTKVNSPAILTREALPDAPTGDWLNTVLDAKNGFDDQVGRALRNGITIGDNTPWKFVDVNMKHGAEIEIKNPFDDQSVTPKNVMVAKCAGIVLDSTGKPTGSTYTLSEPILKWRPSGKSSNSILASAQYLTRDALVVVTQQNSQTFTNGTNNVILFDNTVLSYGESFNYSAGVFTAPFTAIYEMKCRITWENNTYLDIRLQINRNGGASIEGASVINNGTLSGFQNQYASFYQSLNAGDTITFLGQQSNSGLASRTLFVGDGRWFPRAEIKSVATSTDTTGKVTLLFMGE